MKNLVSFSLFRHSVFIFLLLQSSISSAQETKSFVHALKTTPQSQIVFSGDHITAVAVTVEDPVLMIVTLVADSMELLVPFDQDADGNQYFLSLPYPISEGTIVLEHPAPVALYLINSGTLSKATRTESLTLNSCSEPVTYIPQSSWREGLPAPNYNRSFHQVEHVILHHSAGSNTNTNYTQVVRDIYLYHTQVNGWSDIGYNYLVAQNGALYAGRDPDEGEQNLVRGAHFCGKNTGTMGICLLGNYQTTTPSNASITTVYRFLTLVFSELDLNPLESAVHRGNELGRLAGHRDGCATLCPGENYYAQLTDIRQTVFEGVAPCVVDPEMTFTVSDSLIAPGESITLSHQNIGYKLINWVAPGGNPSLSDADSINVTFHKPGSYDISMIVEWLGELDTLTKYDIVKVTYQADLPIFYPNPLSENRILEMDFEETIEQIQLFDKSGNQLAFWNDVSSPIQLPLHLNRGVYFLYFKFEDRWLSRKVVLRN
ncbi:MAG: N-acetylmuramoyl-L-alanine amidase [Cyclobacteriaceae bacterium]